MECVMAKNNKSRWDCLAEQQSRENNKTATSSRPFEAATKPVSGIAALKQVENQIKSGPAVAVK